MTHADLSAMDPPVRLFITTGNTSSDIDQVRSISNIFSGRTGALIAHQASKRGWVTTLAASQSSVGIEVTNAASGSTPPVEIITYRTFDELAEVMEKAIAQGRPDAVIHAAAVSDYLFSGAFGLPGGASFNAEEGRFVGMNSGLMPLESSGKMPSQRSEIWLRLTKAPKLVDRIRTYWNFRGVLVKFKLEVGIDSAELVRRGESARLASQADFLVANTLETMRESATILGPDGLIEIVPRPNLADRLLDYVGGAVEIRRRMK